MQKRHEMQLMHVTALPQLGLLKAHIATRRMYTQRRRQPKMSGERGEQTYVRECCHFYVLTSFMRNYKQETFKNLKQKLIKHELIKVLIKKEGAGAKPSPMITPRLSTIFQLGKFEELKAYKILGAAKLCDGNFSIFQTEYGNSF